MSASRTRARTLHNPWRGLALSAAALAVLVVAAAGVAGPAAARPAAGAIPAAQLQQGLDSLVAQGAPGAILLVRDGKRTLRLTSGLADVAQSRAIRAGDRYRIASLTKTYTATVVLQLVREHKLSLDDSVERWLPGLVPGGERITIRDLLRHTSGIFDFENDPRVTQPYFAGDFAHYWAPRQLVEMAVSHPPLSEPGGAVSSYSSTNYVIAGLIVEAVTGRTIGSELSRRIFRPLHLDATSYPTTPEISGRHAHGYMLVDGPTPIDVTGISPSLSPASGAIVSTVGEVADFYRALLTGRLLEPRLLDAMKTTLPVVGGQDPTWRYGFGLRRYTTACGYAWGHSGGFPGYLTNALTSADGRHQAVLMINFDGSSLSPQAGADFFALNDKAYCSTF